MELGIYIINAIISLFIVVVIRSIDKKKWSSIKIQEFIRNQIEIFNKKVKQKEDEINNTYLELEKMVSQGKSIGNILKEKLDDLDKRIVYIDKFRSNIDTTFNQINDIKKFAEE